MFGTKGASAVEYAVLTALVLLASFIVISDVGIEIERTFKAAADGFKSKLAPILTGVAGEE